ncbi:Asp-tRNA(Asn)/Glu-tRNA(Gln) amidotransferase subunit GatB [Spirosoma sp. KCTC 42546]|uniref:Asp-tRNA(Asn)/Glu-tRNA(Gln) amidotransferase subunit GatB n=1 Tax=Spirosoma sp. KCTC 42546 TaxID=2520506 RepID=UPI001158621D|nr:Asp-tRNA(Asn)/Glu-tRNA(Gln) amidotransferase subunit GatB [Spirosoma sp. KCTC 42546]QDK82905.1 Asp-tRNA(Asn)/Glu-tRNA(Gln) amidotransferase subunit GatB [Spirosoma sp. KCTC 42546]
MVAEATLSPEVLSQYEAVIGLEVHCQLLTQSKIFAADANAFGAEPNTNISVITLGYPGTLPKLNRKAIEFAIRMGLACGSEITRYNVFARKNYFYPDLPKGYQLSQDKGPICVGGGIPIKAKDPVTGQSYQTTIQLHHIHLEEDAGKSIHDGDEWATQLDYNRAGTPLIEMVTDPTIRTADEAGQYLTEVRRLVRYLDICDGNMEEGSLRCDVNVSIRPKGATNLGTKVEVKNLNSIRNVMRAVDSEFLRQVELTESGGRIVQETRTFDAATGLSYGMREKETMNDYRYFPDPDLTPVVISEEWLADIQAQMPVLPAALYQKFTTTYGLPEYDAALLTDAKELAEYYEAVCTQTTNYKAASNWIMGPVKGQLNEKTLRDRQFPVSADQLAALIALIDNGTVSQTAAQQVFTLLTEQPDSSPAELAQKHGLIQNRNTDTLQTLVEEVLAAWPDKVEQYRKGKKNLLGMFVGEVMKKSKGSADPKLVNELLAKTLQKI